MPCAGPSDYELRQMEVFENKKKLGKSWDDHEFAENVACAYIAFVRHGIPLPDWAVRWSDAHEEKDRQRKQAEKNRKAAVRDDKLKTFNKLKKELGL